MDSLAGKVAVVTGSALGIGRAIARRFAKDKATLILIDIDGPALEETARELRAGGAEVLSRTLDVADETGMARLADEVFAKYGHVDLVINNAGVLPPQGGALWQVSLNTWRWGFDVNVIGVLNVTNAFLPRMMKRDSESWIVNVTSHFGGLLVTAGGGVYGATKAALGAVTEILHFELEAAKAPVKAMLFFPGPHTVPTGIYDPEKVRPTKYPRAADEPKPRHMSIDDMQKYMMETYGRLRDTITPEKAADDIVIALREKRAWFVPMSERFERALKLRFSEIAQGQAPSPPHDIM